VWVTLIPRSGAAAMSIENLKGPLEAISLSWGKRSMITARQRCALAHHANYVERLSSLLTNRLLFRNVVGEYSDLGNLS